MVMRGVVRQRRIGRLDFYLIRLKETGIAVKNMHTKTP